MMAFMSENRTHTHTHTHTRTHLFNNRQYPRLVVVVTIGAYAEIDLLWEGICLVSCSKLENAITTV